jgi:hypothetical protein
MRLQRLSLMLDLAAAQSNVTSAHAHHPDQRPLHSHSVCNSSDAELAAMSLVTESKYMLVGVSP